MSFDPDSFDPESFDPDSKQPDLDLYTVPVPPERQDLERERVRELLQSDDYFDPFARPFNPRADELSSDYGFYPVDLSQPAAPTALSGSQYQPEIPRQQASVASSSSRQQQQPHTVLSSASSLPATSSSSGPLLSLHAPAPAAITTPAHNFNLNDMVYYNGVKYQITGVSDTSDTKIYTLQSLNSSQQVFVIGNSELKLDDTPESYAGQIGSLPSASSDLYGTPSAVVADVRMHQCDEPGCLKYYAARSSLLRHIREHSGDRQYKCQFCGKSFSQNNNLTRHVRIHTGEQPFECSVCNMRFTDKSNFRRHMLMNHPGAQPGGYQFMHSIYFNHCF